MFEFLERVFHEHDWEWSEVESVSEKERSEVENGLMPIVDAKQVRRCKKCGREEVRYRGPNFSDMPF